MPIQKYFEGRNQITDYTGFVGTPSGRRLYTTLNRSLGAVGRGLGQVAALPLRAISTTMSLGSSAVSILPLGSVVAAPGRGVSYAIDALTGTEDRLAHWDRAKELIVQDIVAASDKEDFIRRMNARKTFIFGSITQIDVDRALEYLARIELQISQTNGDDTGVQFTSTDDNEVDPPLRLMDRDSGLQDEETAFGLTEQEILDRLRRNMNIPGMSDAERRHWIRENNIVIDPRFVGPPIDDTRSNMQRYYENILNTPKVKGPEMPDPNGPAYGLPIPNALGNTNGPGSRGSSRDLYFPR